MTGPGGRSRYPASASRLAAPVSVALVVVAIDLATKGAVVASLLEGQESPVLALGKAVTVVVVHSPAGSLSLGAVLSGLLAVLSVVVVVGIVRRDQRVAAHGWGPAAGLVLGGVLGNLVDLVAREPTPGGRYVVRFLSVLGSPAFNLADVAVGIGGALMLLLALVGTGPDDDGGTGGTGDTGESEAPSGRSASGTELDPDDEKVALIHRPKYPMLKWDPMPGGPRYLSEHADGPTGTGERAPQDPDERVDPDDLVDHDLVDDDLVDEDDRLPGRTRHPANKWERS